MKNRVAKIADIEVSSREMFLIAGPCVIESEDLCRRVAEHGQEGDGVTGHCRTSSRRRTTRPTGRARGVPRAGVGRRDLEILIHLRDEFGVPVLTDVHTAEAEGRGGEVLDCLQIPAFLCRQTDLVQAAARKARPSTSRRGSSSPRGT